MANPEHLKILKQSVVVWNRWRKANPSIRPDFTNAKLSESNLFARDLSEADFAGADLARSRFTGAKLIKAGFRKAFLSKAILSGANLRQTDLWRANLSRAYLGKANLLGANLIEANLAYSNLNKANLSNANLAFANLFEADLTSANLFETDFSRAILTKAKLDSANLQSAYFFYTDVRETSLQQANLTGATLFKPAITGWKIERILCDHIFIDEQKRIRKPLYRDFEPGEFETLYRSLPTIEYVFEHGMRWIDAPIMNTVSLQLQSRYPESGIALISIDGKGFYPKAIFEILEEKFRKKIEPEIHELYQEKFLRLESKLDGYKEIIQNAINQPRQINTRVYNEVYQGKVELDMSIHIANITQPMRNAIRQEPAQSFKRGTKRKVIEHLDNIAKEGTKEGAKALAKEFKDYVTENAPSLLAKISPYLVQLLTM